MRKRIATPGWAQNGAQIYIVRHPGRCISAAHEREQLWPDNRRDRLCSDIQIPSHAHGPTALTPSGSIDGQGYPVYPGWASLSPPQPHLVPPPPRFAGLRHPWDCGKASAHLPFDGVFRS